LSSKAPTAVPTPRAAATASASSSSNKGWWAGLTDMLSGVTGATTTAEPIDCAACNNERVVGCGNCDGVGSYVTYGRTVQCPVCKGTGLVICRDCFNGDPYDIEGIRATVRAAAERMGRLPPSA
jgi:DnaJ-class molecular chaperone